MYGLSLQVCGDQVCMSGSRDWWSSECISLRIRASAHQHKALNIYADPESLTAPSPSHTLQSHPSPLLPLLHILCSHPAGPLSTHAHSQAHELCFLWLIMRPRQEKNREIGGLDWKWGKWGCALVQIEELFRLRQVANLMLFVRPHWHQSATPRVLNNGNSFYYLFLFWTKEKSIFFRYWFSCLCQQLKSSNNFLNHVGFLRLNLLLNKSLMLYPRPLPPHNSKTLGKIQCWHELICVIKQMHF